jgi:formate dehydrogenase major subunit
MAHLKPLTRRQVVGGLGPLAAGTAIGAMAGLGIDLRPVAARAEGLRIREARAYPSVCCYCSVGCGTLVHVDDGQIVNIEGNPASPINYGNLCPKGAALFQLHINPNRLTRVLHRRPGGTAWETMDLDEAMDRVARLVKKTRDATWADQLANGSTVNHTTAIFSLGGALLDDEWNHIHQKLMRGLGIVAIENQARI